MITAVEHRERQARASEGAAERGLAGLLVWSQRTMHGDVTYLTGHRTSFPDMADTPNWSGKSCSALVLPIDGTPILVIDLPIGPDDAAVADVRTRIDLLEGVAEALAQTGLDRRPLGLVGSMTLRHSSLARIERTLGHALTIEPADDVVAGLRLVKSPAEIELLRAAAAVGVTCMDAMLETVAPGLTEGDMIGVGLDILARNGGCSAGIVVASGNPCRPRGPRPNVQSWDATRPIEAGDMMRLDLAGQVNGYHTDHARSIVIGAEPSPGQLKVMEDALELVSVMVAAVRPSATVGDVHDVGAAWLAEHGYPPYGVYGSFWPSFGHGLGLELEPPYIEAGEPTQLVPGVVLSIETILGHPEVGGATYEDTVVVTETGCEALTAGSRAKWWS